MTVREYDKEKILDLIDREWIPLDEGIRWSCIRCGKCCRTNWRINLTWKEHERIINGGNLRAIPEFHREVDPGSGLDHPYIVIDGECPLLVDGNICSIYPDWPFTCATYPFLLMPDGAIMLHSDCPGIGSGDIIDMDEMRGKIMVERKKAGMKV